MKRIIMGIALISMLGAGQAQGMTEAQKAQRRQELTDSINFQENWYKGDMSLYLKEKDPKQKEILTDHMDQLLKVIASLKEERAKI